MENVIQDPFAVLTRLFFEHHTGQLMSTIGKVEEAFKRLLQVAAISLMVPYEIPAPDAVPHNPFCYHHTTCAATSC